MVHHLWYDTFDAEADDGHPAAWRTTMTRRPPPRRGGARRAVGRALVDLGERIASEHTSSTKAVGE